MSLFLLYTQVANTKNRVFTNNNKFAYKVISGQHSIDQNVNIEHNLWKCVNIHAELHKNTLLNAKSQYYNACTSCKNPSNNYI